LAEVDARLRPWGEQGALVTTLPALGEYWKTPREMWERMAMVRAAWFAGDPRLGDDALAIIRAQAVAAPRPADWARQVREMRSRLEQSVAGEDHIKRGPGGYVDAEFVAQALSLGLPELPDPPATAACLRRLGQAGAMPQGAAQALAEGLAFLRQVENRLRLTDGRAVSALPRGGDERDRLARRCGLADAATLDAQLGEVRTSLRRWFDAVIPAAAPSTA
jgi:glutamate-ammonia-ligase adenylyltransferase